MSQLPSFLKSRRLWGLTGTGLMMYFIVFVVLGNINVEPYVPTHRIASAIIEAWPHLPFFSVQEGTGADGTSRERYYTVTTRQFTPEELARMQGTNRVIQPTAPK